jgi:hypothetical protein
MDGGFLGKPGGKQGVGRLVSLGGGHRVFDQLQMQ